jgi:hypothetical protein
LVLDPANDTIGSVNVNLFNATDLSLNINADGTANSVSTTSPGQNAHLNFATSIGQRISALVTNISYPGQQPDLTLRRVDSGGAITNVQGSATDGSNRFMEPFTISQSGSYSLLVDPPGQSIGSETLALYMVNDLSGTIGTAGTPIAISTTVPGQNANYTFTANSGQTLTWTGSGVTYPANRCQISILNPNSTRLALRDCYGTTGSWSQSLSLTQTGTYTINVDPVQSTTGTLKVSVTVQ